MGEVVDDRIYAGRPGHQGRPELDFVRRVRRAIHGHPELGHDEHRTANYVERILVRMGLKPFRPAPTSVAAVVGRPDTMPIVGFRADMDAIRVTEASGTA